MLSTCPHLVRVRVRVRVRGRCSRRVPPGELTPAHGTRAAQQSEAREELVRVRVRARAREELVVERLGLKVGLG